MISGVRHGPGLIMFLTIFQLYPGSEKVAGQADLAGQGPVKV